MNQLWMGLIMVSVDQGRRDRQLVTLDTWEGGAHASLPSVQAMHAM